MATLGRLKARTVAEIGGYNVTDDTTLLGEWANDAVRDLLLQTGVKVGTAPVTLTANVADYTLDNEVLLIKHAYIDGTTDHILTQVSGGDLLAMRIAGGGVTSSDGPWYFALEGNDLLRMYPTPASAGTIQLTFVPKPTELSADADDPSTTTYGGIPTEFHPALLAYMYWKAASADDDQSSGQGERYKADYQDEIRKVRKYVNGKGGVRLPRARVGRRRFVPSDPSADWR